MTLQEQVMKYCEDNGIKLGFVAKKVGLYQSVLSAWLHGKKTLDSYYTRQLKENFTEKK